MSSPHNRECSSCFFSTSFPGVVIESNGRCSICNGSGTAVSTQGPGVLGIEALREAAQKLRKGGRGRYDCVVGASGGLDSSYVLYVAKNLLGLNPLAVHYDHGLGHDLAQSNLRTLCDRLGVDLKVVRSSQRNDLKFMRSMVLALSSTGLYWGMCQFCHYILSAVIYKHSLEEDVPILLTHSNIYEKDLHMPRGFKRRLMARGLLRSGVIGLPRFIFYFALAQYYLLRLKLEFYLPPVSNLFARAPTMPAIATLSVSKHVPWDIDSMVRVLEQETGWRAPEGTRVPMRFDCMVEDSFINQTYKRAGGLTVHGIICNNLIHAGVRTKAELQGDVARYDAQLDRCVEEAMVRLGLK